MSIASEITRLQNAKATLKTKLNAKNDQQHQITNETLDNYGTFVDSIPTGGGFAPTFISFSRYSGTNTQIANDISGVDFSNIIGANYMFSNITTTSITTIDLSAKSFPTTSLVYEYLCYSDNRLQRFVFCKDNQLHKANMLNYAFRGCTALTYCDLSTMSDKPSLNNAFQNCTALNFLDIRNLNISGITSYSNAFASVPSSCTIVVKDTTEKNAFQNKFGTSWTNLKTVAEYEQ